MDPDVTPEMLQQLWNDPLNWKAGLFYNCKADPRVIVPKKIGIGWTINFGRAAAIPVLTLLIVFVPVPLVLLALHGLAGTWIWWTVLGGSLVVTSLVCRHLASPARYKK